ncbi:hypothetical protein BKA61DRAFT_667311 [Leptodontidium sp. MPI-SDFR-AT-0119]|nr:hypothetical protein BKA61DRAFT_667311 [Leptodontidium sp. MPI-SDFR-AT-0119]
MDAWTQYTNHNPHEPYEVLYDTGSFEADVFAVHGLGSDPASAWTYRGANGTSVRWLKDLLPYRKGFGDIRVTMLNHQTRWDSHSAAMSFEDHAAKLLDDVEDIHKPGVPIIFISHSFGGLLLKKALILARHKSSEIAASTKGILFLGVPHGGTQAVYLASFLSCTAYWRGSSPALLEYMSPGGSAITELEKDFYNAYVKNSWRDTQTLPYVCDFIEMRKERIGKLSLAPTVGINSAGSYRHGDVVHLDADHRGLNKFSSATDPNFRDFCRHFEIALELAKGEATGRQPVRPKKLSTLKAVSTVPFEQDKNFIGRKEVISQLDTIYSREEFHNRAALVGWGGIGKTQIAIEYSYRVRERNPNVWVFWLHAGQADLFTQAYIEIGNKVNLSLKNTDPDIKNLQEVYDWLHLEVHEPWLMILDNADDVDLFYQNKSPESNNQSFISLLPRVPHGSILITSRDRMAAFDMIGAPDNNHNIVDVMMMNEEDALGLLKSRLPESLFDEESAKELLSLLGYVPLAITQACAYISRTPVASIPRYIALVNGNSNVLKKGIVDHRRYPGISNAVFTTWAISFEQIRNQRPSSAEMLSLMSVLDRHRIPESLLVSYKEIQLQRTGLRDTLSKLVRAISLKLWHATDLQDQENASLALKTEVEEDLELLIGFSLIAIDTNDGTYQMHRLVQRATEDWLKDRHELSIWQSNLIELLASRYPEGFRSESYTSCRLLQVHADKALSYHARNHNLLLDQARLFYQSGWYTYSFVGDYLDALKRVEKAISIRKEVYAEASPPMQECINLKALCLVALGNLTEGEALLYKVMWTRAKVWGFAHSSTLGSLENIGLMLHEQERFKEAEAVLREVVEVRRIKWPRSSYTDKAWDVLSWATGSLLRLEFDDLMSMGHDIEEREGRGHSRDFSDEELELLLLRQLQYEYERPGWLLGLEMPVSGVVSFLYQREKYPEVVILCEKLWRNSEILGPLLRPDEYADEDIVGLAAEKMTEALIDDAYIVQAAWLWHDFLGENTQTNHERVTRKLNQTSTWINRLLELGLLSRKEYSEKTAILHSRSSFYRHYKTPFQLPNNLQRETKSNLARLAKGWAQELRAAIAYYESLKGGPRVPTAYDGLDGLYSYYDFELEQEVDSSPPFGLDYVYTVEDVEILDFINTWIQIIAVVQKYLSDAALVEASLMIENNRTREAEAHLIQAIALQNDLAFNRELNQPLIALLYRRAINFRLQNKYQESATIFRSIAGLEYEMEHNQPLQDIIEKDLNWIHGHIDRELYHKAVHSLRRFWDGTLEGCDDAEETLLRSLHELLLISPNLSSPYSFSFKYKVGYFYVQCNQYAKAIPWLEEYLALNSRYDYLGWRTEKRLEAALRLSVEAKNNSASMNVSHFTPSSHGGLCTACKRSWTHIFYCSICHFNLCPDCTAHGMWCQNQSHTMTLVQITEDGQMAFDYSISFNNTERAFLEIRTYESTESNATGPQPEQRANIDPRIEAAYWIFWILFAIFWDSHHRRAARESKERELTSGNGSETPVMLRRHTS